MDVLVTIPQSFGLDRWVDEGDLPGESWCGMEWDFYLPGFDRPKIAPGERVYVCYKGRIRGYAPLVRVGIYDNISERTGRHYTTYSLIRHNGAVAVTVPDLYVRGFRGVKYRVDSWPEERPKPENIIVWRRDHEIPFPNWWKD